MNITVKISGLDQETGNALAELIVESGVVDPGDGAAWGATILGGILEEKRVRRLEARNQELGDAFRSADYPTRVAVDQLLTAIVNIPPERRDLVFSQLQAILNP